MPEGAEVRRNGDLIRHVINGKIVVKAEAVSGKLLRTGIKGELKVPFEVVDVCTRGKVIFIETVHLSGNPVQDADYQWIISTLGMSGWWYPGQLSAEIGDQLVYSRLQKLKQNTVRTYVEAARKYSRYELTTQEGDVLFYSDARNFGNLSAVSYNEYQKKWNSIGIDLSYPGNDISIPLEELRLVRNSNKQLGEVLLDQSVLSGLGNIYRAESLYLAGLSPFRTVSDCTDLELKRLINFASWVLSIAYESQGVMIYYNQILKAVPHLAPLVTSGDPWTGHMIYSSTTDPLSRAVRQETCAGRTMWWVPEVQA